MNKSITRLHKIASRKSRLVVGLMSGTSLDGLDVALCRISGSGLQTQVNVLNFITIPYQTTFRSEVLQIFAKQQISFQILCELNAGIGQLHGQLVLKALKKWGIAASKVDIIASHGQTVFHSPKALTVGAKINSTLQIGDGDHLAVTTGIITLSDFRQKHVAKGGEGAPLAVYGDYLLFTKKGENRIMLNMGGIGNFTYLPASAKPNEVFVTDTGPANTLLDQLVRLNTVDKTYDQDAAFARKGICNEALLNALLDHPFFSLPFPKTIGPELFNLSYLRAAQQKSNTMHLSFENLMATLTHFSASSIVKAIKKVTRSKKDFKVYYSGGGAHNPLMMDLIKKGLPDFSFYPMQQLGISGDAKEAVLFAVLANETLVGKPIDFGKRTKVPGVNMGKISFPD